MRTRKRFWPPALLALGLAFLLPGRAAERPEPKKWGLRLTLQTTGRYQVIEQGTTYKGDFSFTLDWEGTMEEDADDFRLVQGEARMLDWAAHETSSAALARSFMTTADFPEKPSFGYVYVLREGGLFQIVFCVEGFSVPVHAAAEKLVLDLPRTAKSTYLSSDVDYDVHVSRGSNVLAFPAGSLDDEPLERTIAWTWRHQRWQPTQDQIIFCLNDHKVMAKVIIRRQDARS